MTTANASPTSTSTTSNGANVGQVTSADRRQDRQLHRSDRRSWWPTALSWAGFVAGCAVVVLCAFMVKNSTHWNPHMGGPIGEFLILFALMLIAGLLIMGGITKAVDWAKARIRPAGSAQDS
jgi:hypothetical protein